MNFSAIGLSFGKVRNHADLGRILPNAEWLKLAGCPISIPNLPKCKG